MKALRKPETQQLQSTWFTELDEKLLDHSLSA